jgi:hypothetical protein
MTSFLMHGCPADIRDVMAAAFAEVYDRVRARSATAALFPCGR